MIDHEFTELGNTNLCARCYKPRTTHLPDPLTSDPTNQPTNQPETPTTQETITEINCPGHVCANCAREFFHDFKCSKVGRLCCGKCDSQFAAEIYRLEDIEPKAGLTARDVTELLIQHEQFVCLEFNDKPNWMDLYDAHLHDIELKLESYQLKLRATQTARMKKRTEEMTKLTPEEKAQYVRDASKSKKRDAENEKAQGKKAYQAMLKNLVTLVGNEAAAKAKLEEMYKLQGKEIPE